MNFKRELRPIRNSYLLLVTAVLLLILLADWRSGYSLKTTWQRWSNLLTNATFLIVFHVFFLVWHSGYMIIRYLWRAFRKHGWKIGLKRTLAHVALPLGILVLGYHTIVGYNTLENYDFAWDLSVENTNGTSNDLYAVDGKHRGMSVFGSKKYQEKDTDDVIKDNIEWVAVIPFMDQEHEETPVLRSSYTETRKWRDSITTTWIQRWHDKGVQVHLKPHIWLSNGWRSNIRLSDADWEIWFDSYHKTMVHYAKLAEKNKVALLCIGTELRTAIQKMPHKWPEMIKDIKAVYNGKLTYAANWDDPISDVPFWDDMDYIGIQAYFPLTENKLPELETIKAGWQEHKEMLEKAAIAYDKPILFTEVGYRSDVSATIAPWEWGNSLGALYNKKSDRTQELAYEALFSELWKESWFAGCYIWQWHTHSKEENVHKNVDFTPRFKPAENTIAKWYGTIGEPVQE